MKIGLVRHFKVKQSFPSRFLVHYDELVKWFDTYEYSEIEYHDVDLCGITWKKCYASTSVRAIQTAQHIFKGDIIMLDHLKELNVLPSMKSNLRLPVLLWGILIRKKSLSPNDYTNELRKNINIFLDEILSQNEKEVLIVSHGLVMMHMQTELIRRGFTGKKFSTPVNGKLYLFEN